MKLTVIGTGYVGLVQGVCLADLGNQVTCIDTDKNKIALLKKGIAPFFEPGLSELIQKNLANNKISFDTHLEKAVKNSDIVFIAVGTPAKKNGEADISSVLAVATSIANVIKTYTIIVTKSTVPVGTGKKIITILSAQGFKESIHFDVISNPEFLREGSAINDFFKPDRVVLGGNNADAIKKVGELYQPLYRIEAPFITTDLHSAELGKYAANAFLATKISFINEMANLCDAMGADIHKVAKILGSDGRIGHYFLHPGPGYGGSCFPKDSTAIMAMAKMTKTTLNVIQGVIDANNYQTSIVMKKLQKALPSLNKKTITILGLAYKPKTDDIRDSPALTLIESLQKNKHVHIKVYDPEAMPNCKKIYPNIHYFDSPYEASHQSDALILMTEWNSLRRLDLEKIKKSMTGNLFIDARNMYNPKTVREIGFTYLSIGRDSVQ